ncbi:MAG: very short patch repair endonuclease [Thermoanaerobaculia bacterium]
MSRVRGSNTKPEVQVRSFLHHLGYRFRLHQRGLPGRPDIVLPRYRTVIFVHGCFWHQHPGCSKATLPETNAEEWAAKLARNVERDEENSEALQALGWKVATVWECDLKTTAAVISSLSKILTDINERVENRSSVNNDTSHRSG